MCLCPPLAKVRPREEDVPILMAEQVVEVDLDPLDSMGMGSRTTVPVAKAAIKSISVQVSIWRCARGGCNPPAASTFHASNALLSLHNVNSQLCISLYLLQYCLSAAMKRNTSCDVNPDPNRQQHLHVTGHLHSPLGGGPTEHPHPYFKCSRSNRS